MPVKCTIVEGPCASRQIQQSRLFAPQHGGRGQPPAMGRIPRRVVAVSLRTVQAMPRPRKLPSVPDPPASDTPTAARSASSCTPADPPTPSLTRVQHPFQPPPPDSPTPFCSASFRKHHDPHPPELGRGERLPLTLADEGSSRFCSAKRLTPTAASGLASPRPDIERPGGARWARRGSSRKKRPPPASKVKGGRAWHTLRRPEQGRGKRSGRS